MTDEIGSGPKPTIRGQRRWRLKIWRLNGDRMSWTVTEVFKWCWSRVDRAWKSKVYRIKQFEDKELINNQQPQRNRSERRMRIYTDRDLSTANHDDHEDLPRFWMGWQELSNSLWRSSNKSDDRLIGVRTGRLKRLPGNVLRITTDGDGDRWADVHVWTRSRAWLAQVWKGWITELWRSDKSRVETTNGWFETERVRSTMRARIGGRWKRTMEWMRWEASWSERVGEWMVWLRNWI